MKLLSFHAGTEERFGAVRGDGIVDLTGHEGHKTLLSVLRAGATDSLRLAAEAGQPNYALDEVSLLLPIPEPRMILCVGMNYRDPAAPQQDPGTASKYPSMFLRLPDSFAAHGQPLLRPRVSPQLDYEGEIVLVIGKAGRHVPDASALDHVFGLSIANEGCVRDWMRHSKVNAAQGKNFDRSGSIGPWIVTADEIDLNKPLRLVSRVNGEVRQNDTTESMIFPFRFLISYISAFTTIKPGDMILTGAPVGAGNRFDPPKWLSPGDILEISVPEIGTLRNSVADENQGPV